MIVDGRALAGEILARTKVRAVLLPRPPKVVAIVANETPATQSYLRIKTARAADAGCLFETRPLGTEYADADAVIVQLPLPAGIDAKNVLDAIPLEKDADVLSSAARALFENGDLRNPHLLPPVVGAVQAIFEYGKVDAVGKQAVVVGEGFLVGAPVAMWLRQQGAEVTVVNDTTTDLAAALHNADIIVSGAGSPGLITPDMLKEGVVLIDAGTSELGGKLVGDADPACAAKCSLFTPVPGGVGPVAVACLFANVMKLAEQNIDKSRNKA